MRPRWRRPGHGDVRRGLPRGAPVGRARRRGARCGRHAGRGNDRDAAAGRHSQRPGARRGRRLARAARALRATAPRRGAGAGHRAGRRRVSRVHHAGAWPAISCTPSPARASSARTGRSRSARRVRVPGIARTLRAIARDGRAGFYEGEFGRGLLELGGGHFHPEDLAASAATWCTPLRVGAWGHELWTVPPPSQGYLTLAGAVGRRSGRPRDRPGRPGVGAPAGRDAGAPSGTTGPRSSSTVPTATRSWIAAVSRLPRPRGSTAAGPRRPTSRRAAARGDPDVARLGDGDTTHLCAMDGDGLGISLTQSNALDFGSHLVGAEHRRVPAQPRGRVLARRRAIPAEVAPGRRPPHTLSPMLVTGPDGALDASSSAPWVATPSRRSSSSSWRACCTAGRTRRPPSPHPGSRSTRPRPGPFRLWWGEDLTVLVESDAPPAWLAELAGHGHRVQAIGAFDPVAVGCAQIIAAERGGDGRCASSARRTPAAPRGRRRLLRRAGARGQRGPGSVSGIERPGSLTLHARHSFRIVMPPLHMVTLQVRLVVARAWVTLTLCASRRAKQVPVAESLLLEDGRLVRAGAVEMNPYCRRAVAEGVTLARDTGGNCTVGDARAPGGRGRAARGGGLGSRRRAARLRRRVRRIRHPRHGARARRCATRGGPFDLVLRRPQLHRRGDGQVGPELAELLDLPSPAACASWRTRAPSLRLELEHRRRDARGGDRRCPPCSRWPSDCATPARWTPRAGRRSPPALLARVSAGDLGAGPWGEAGSPTVVGATRPMEHGAPSSSSTGPSRRRSRRPCASWPAAVRWPRTPPRRRRRRVTATSPNPQRPDRRPTTPRRRPGRRRPDVEPGRPGGVGRGAARRGGAASAREVGAAVHAVCARSGAGAGAPAAGADVVVVLEGSGAAGDLVAEDVADALRRLRARRGPVGRARPEHSVRPRGGRPRRRRDGLGTRGRRHRAVGARRRAWWRPSRPSPARWWPTSRAAAPRRWSPCDPGVLPAPDRRPRRGTGADAAGRHAGTDPGAVRTARRRRRDAGPGRRRWSAWAPA